MFGLVYLASQIAIGLIVRPLGADVFIVQTTLSADRVREIFAKWEAAGLLPTYAAHYRFDVIHPLWYGVLLAALLAKTFEGNDVPARFDALLLVPFVAAACDVTENVLHLTYLADRASITAGRVLVSNGAAILKWALAAGTELAIGVLAVRATRSGSSKHGADARGRRGLSRRRC